MRGNTCHRVSICYQTVPRFQIVLRQNFSTWFFFQSDQKIRLISCRANLISFSDALTSWLSASFLTCCFLGIQVTAHFAVYSFRNKSPMRLIIFFKVVKILCRFRRGRKNIQKIFFDFKIIAFELVALNTRFYWES